MASPIKVIHRKGPIQVEDGIINAALRPGTFVKRDSNSKWIACAATDDNADIFVLDKFQMQGKTIDEAYAVGNPCRAYRCLAGAVMQVRAEAHNYTVNTPVTVNASGQITATVSGKEILGYVETANNVSATDVTNHENLVEVTFSNRPAAG